MLNEVLIIQILIFILLFFFLNILNLLILWYIAGFYLVLSSTLLFFDHADIFIGFLWLIDLGVGLIFFIFILHFTNFLFNKIRLKLNYKVLIFSVLILFLLWILTWINKFPFDINFNKVIYKIWYFLISWYDYYDFFYNFFKTDLNVLREIYFYNNSFEFILLNFVLFYGILNTISLCFFTKKIFIFLNMFQYKNLHFLNVINTIFFIRNQDLINQQMEFAATRVWMKKKYKNYDL